jgi:hypothetical protein
VDEHWTQARGGMLLGISRLTMASKVAMFEYMHVEVREGHRIVLVVQRRGGSPMDFAWTSGGRGFAVFSLEPASVKEPGPIWPSRILYGRAGDKLHVRFEDASDEMVEEVVLHPAVVARWRSALRPRRGLYAAERSHQRCEPAGRGARVGIVEECVLGPVDFD